MSAREPHLKYQGFEATFAGPEPAPFGDPLRKTALQDVTPEPASPVKMRKVARIPSKKKPQRRRKEARA